MLNPLRAGGRLLPGSHLPALANSASTSDAFLSWKRGQLSPLPLRPLNYSLMPEIRIFKNLPYGRFLPLNSHQKFEAKAQCHGGRDRDGHFQHNHTHSHCLAWGCSGSLGPLTAAWRCLGLSLAPRAAAGCQCLPWRKEPKVAERAKTSWKTEVISLVATAPWCLCAMGHLGGRSFGESLPSPKCPRGWDDARGEHREARCTVGLGEGEAEKVAGVPRPTT